MHSPWTAPLARVVDSPMAMDYARLLDDLQTESAVLDARLGGLTRAHWSLDTPAAGWTIADQVSHLAFFDDAATLSGVDPDRFRIEADGLIATGRDFA